MKFSSRLNAEYQSLWNGMTVSASKQAEARTRAKIILASKARYQAIEERTGVPWHFVGLVHYRECNNNFKGVLHNGQLIVGTGRKTTIVPKNRGPFTSWEEAAYDSLVRVQRYSKDMDWSLGPYVYRIEGYNGYGYHSHGIPSPYLWGGSSKQARGKYVKDGVFDPNTWDTQLGVLTILRSLVELDHTVTFGDKPVNLPPVPAPPPDVEPEQEPTQPPPSPKADDNTKPASKSTTIWAAILAFLSQLAAFATDWRVMGIVVLAIIVAYIIWQRNGKPDIKGIFSCS